MPSNTTLTQTPTPLLTDAANIETAVGPGFQNVEKFTIPRFTSLSAATAAFATAPPSLHQLRWISSLGHRGLQIYDGEEWVDYGEFVQVRPVKVRLNNDVGPRNSTHMGSVGGLAVPVTTGTYDMTGVVLYNGPSDVDFNIGFTYPGTNGSMVTFNHRAGHTSTAYPAAAVQVAERGSGGFTRLASCTGSESPLPIFLTGVIRVEGTGEFQVTYARATASGGVTVFKDSWVSLLKVSELPDF